MNSPKKETEEVCPSVDAVSNGASASGGGDAASSADEVRPPAKRPAPAVIEISDTDSDDSDICAVTSYQATADEVKRIRGDEYSSSSSSSDYSSDSESPWEDDSIVIQDERERSKVLRAQLNPRANRTDDPLLNTRIKSQEMRDKVMIHWKEQKDLKNADITLTGSPFRLCLLHNLLSNPEIINNIVDDMNTLDWSRKKMDLYEFHQTADLASLTWQRSIRGIYDLLKTDIMSWVSSVTGLTLTAVSASCSLYGPGDHLLVHDDLLADRRVAFILYLAPWTPNHKQYSRGNVENGGNGHDKEVETIEVCDGSGWSAHMGGALELLACDDQGRPSHVAHAVHPRNNMLAFFRVGAESFHQVGEVLSLELPRLSINGWFHGPPPPGEPEPAEPLPPPAPPLYRPHSEVVVLSEWVEPTYMSPRSRAQIQSQMEQDSELSLRSFLAPHKYTELIEQLRHVDIPWEWVGPSNQRRYQRLPADYLDTLERESPVREVCKLVGSPAWFRLLADCTDLTLKTFERLELQKWTPGDFTLLPSREHYQEARLEMVMYLDVPARAICGGSTSYVAPEEAGAPAGTPHGALVTLPPVSNALCLVYCDAGAASFTKYLSKMTMSETDHFYILTATYRE